jgi:AraC-like DNA-binding protein
MSRKKERREIETLHDPHPMKLSHAGNKAVCVQGNQATGTKLIFSTCHEIEVPIESNFLIKVDTIITRHLNDADFKVNDLSRALHISRTQLHRKMKAATNKSTSHVVRSLRLCKARNLLFSTNLKVTEVAYDTGFKDPNHFSRVFKQEFGISPSKIRKAKILNSA